MGRSGTGEGTDEGTGEGSVDRARGVDTCL